LATMRAMASTPPRSIAASPSARALSASAKRISSVARVSANAAKKSTNSERGPRSDGRSEVDRPVHSSQIDDPGQAGYRGPSAVNAALTPASACGGGSA
jgi:hypothetical protein